MELTQTRSAITIGLERLCGYLTRNGHFRNNQHRAAWLVKCGASTPPNSAHRSVAIQSTLKYPHAHAWRTRGSPSTWFGGVECRRTQSAPSSVVAKATAHRPRLARPTRPRTPPPGAMSIQHPGDPRRVRARPDEASTPLPLHTVSVRRGRRPRGPRIHEIVRSQGDPLDSLARIHR